MTGRAVPGVLGSLLLVLAAGCGSDDGAAGDLQVERAVIPLPAGDNAALYFTVRNGGDPVELAALRSPAAPTLVVHETTMQDGLLVMRAVEGPLVLDSGTTALEPGGLHVMLVGVTELTLGEAVPVSVELGDGSVLRFDAEVVDVADPTHDYSDPAQHGPGADHQHPQTATSTTS